jgi:hypothetical protein
MASQTGRSWRGILNDVHDLDAVRRHFRFVRNRSCRSFLHGTHDYLVCIELWTVCSRLIQIGAIQPVAGTQYPSHLAGNDSTLADVLALNYSRTQDQSILNRDA